MIRAILIFAIAGALSWSTPAEADKETSIQLYKAGKRKYELAEYKRAIVLFQQAYEEHPFPNYQFNLAMAHLKLEDCTEALTHFRRFLDEKPDATNRETVEGHIATLSGKCGGPIETTDPVTDDGSVEAPSENAATETGIEVAQNESATTATEDTGATVSAHGETGRAPLVTGSADVGVAFFSIGDVIVPATPSLRLAAAHPRRLFGGVIEPHAAIELQTMAYDHAVDTDSTVMFTTLLIGATATYPAEGKVRFGGDLGMGIFRFSGLKMGNPFIAGGGEQAGAINSFAFRLGLQAEYDIGNGLAAALAPAYVVSPGADALRDEISSISRLELMLGVRYRL